MTSKARGCQRRIIHCIKDFFKVHVYPISTLLHDKDGLKVISIECRPTTQSFKKNTMAWNNRLFKNLYLYEHFSFKLPLLITF